MKEVMMKHLTNVVAIICVTILLFANVVTPGGVAICFFTAWTFYGFGILFKYMLEN